MQLSHDGTDANFNFGGTTELNINTVPLVLTQGSLYITEKASAGTSTATRGQLWVKNNAPSSLYYTDDTGADVPLVLDGAMASATGYPETFKYKTATENVNNSTTLQDDDHFTGWTMKAASLYKVEGLLIVQGYSTSDWKWSWVHSQTPVTSRLCMQGSVSIGATALHWDGSLLTGNLTLSGSANVHYLRVDGMVQTHATTDGTLKFQWAQNTAQAHNTSILLGSWISVTRMG